MSKKKNKVIEIATMLFAKNGFENTSMANICSEAKVSKGLVYHHFKSKESILIEIFTLTTNEMIQMNNQYDSEVDPKARLVALIKTIFSRLESDKLFFQFNLNITFQPLTKKLLEDQIKERASILFDNVKNIFDEISPKKSTIQTYMFIAEIDGIALNYLSVFDNYPLGLIEKQLIRKYSTISK